MMTADKVRDVAVATLALAFVVATFVLYHNIILGPLPRPVQEAPPWGGSSTFSGHSGIILTYFGDNSPCGFKYFSRLFDASKYFLLWKYNKQN